jgi:hypothetical protein
VIGRSISQIPPYALGYNPYVGVGAAGPFLPGYGYGAALSTGIGYGGYGGYGASLASTYGAGVGATLDSSALNSYIPSVDPYGGYFRGAADITNANGRYLSQVQQARLLQTQADMSKLDLRRRIAEEAAIERRNAYNPEAERVKDMQAALEHYRRDPPSTEILSGQALNSLLSEAFAQLKTGKKAASAVPLPDPDLMNHINLTGEGSGSIGLLKDNANLQWPAVLQEPEFDSLRKNLTQLAGNAVQQLKFGNAAENATIRDMEADVKKLSDALVRNVGDTSPDDYIAAKRFLNSLNSAVKALRDPNVANHFNRNWQANAKNINELVDMMRSKGLRFAPAVSSAGDDPAYRALYNAMLAYDAALNQNVATAAPAAP